MDATIHRVKKVQLANLHKQSEGVWVRYVKVTTNDEEFELTMFADTKEALQVIEPRKV